MFVETVMPLFLLGEVLFAAPTDTPDASDEIIPLVLTPKEGATDPETDVEHVEQTESDARRPARGGPLTRTAGYVADVVAAAVHRAVVLLVALALLAALKTCACWCGWMP